MNNYEKQAWDFLEKHNIKFKAKYIDDRPSPWGQDGVIHAYYRITLTRKHKAFGSNTEVFCPKDVKMRVTFPFYQSIAQASEKPTPYDILTCITKSNPGSFEEFCGEFGYETDSISALKTYKAVLKEWQKVDKFFSKEELEELQEIN